MKSESGHKYLVSSGKDQMWGITVDTVGSQTVPPGYEVYPPRVGHPSGFYFDVGKGRILESCQLLYITSGRGLFYGCSRERIEIGPGDMILLRPNRWHSYRPDRETGWHEYWIGFRGPNVDARFRNDFFDDNLEVFRVGVREEIVDLYDKAREVAENERSSYQQYLAGIANLLLGMAMYYHANHQFVSQEVVGQIDRARRIMRDEFSTGISPEEVARRVNMSYSWFRKMFRDYTNLSPARYMQQLRLQEACRLLSGTSLSIKEIAFRINCGDASYFSNLFRRHLRMTPVEYRMRFGFGCEPAGTGEEEGLPES
ncbi:MAG TPA: AraC family transcriptional regulator [Candidatus Alistipes intestinigallinarum]|uniref:AraC family transcriptional regulator n=1 Tax=Candidatus Alistipes intestinigallinarum TaxID=2838440 RepID=A0A9D1Z2B4_9BACT|nr:AraC family transcriptional regulator [Candidatus Alistipes intestinigallinarum]